MKKNNGKIVDVNGDHRSGNAMVAIDVDDLYHPSVGKQVRKATREIGMDWWDTSRTLSGQLDTCARVKKI